MKITITSNPEFDQACFVLSVQDQVNPKVKATPEDRDAAVSLLEEHGLNLMAKEISEMDATEYEDFVCNQVFG